MYEALIKALRTCVDKDKDCSDCPYEERCRTDKTGRLVPMVDAAQALEDSIDYMPVVLCKDCKWQGDDEHCPVCNCCGREALPNGEWYCARGERKEDPT